MDGTLPTFRGCRFQGHWYIGDLLNHLYICFKVTKILANPNQVWFSLSNREIQLQFTLTDPNTYSEPSQHILLSRMVYSSRLTSSTNMFISWNYTIFLCTRSIIVVSVHGNQLVRDFKAKVSFLALSCDSLQKWHNVDRYWLKKPETFFLRSSSLNESVVVGFGCQDKEALKLWRCGHLDPSTSPELVSQLLTHCFFELLAKVLCSVCIERIYWSLASIQTFVKLLSIHTNTRLCATINPSCWTISRHGYFNVHEFAPIVHDRSLWWAGL